MAWTLTSLNASGHKVKQRRGLLNWAPLLALLVMIGPVFIGVLGTLLPAVGWLPALGGHHLSLDPLHGLFAWPGLPRATSLSILTGVVATALSLIIVMLICAGWHGTRAFSAVERLLSPLLSVPHAAAAFGLAFLISPSGWVARGLSPWLTGWERPPDLLILQDPMGLALIGGLVIKEVPFLLLMTLAALSQVQPDRSRMVARSLGYGPVTGWIKVVFPRVYSQIRLPVYAVLAYSMSVVDVALILGPNTPSPLSVQVLKWMNDPDLALRFRAAAGASLQLILVLVTLAVWRIAELVAMQLGCRWIERGGRGRPLIEAILRRASLLAASFSALAVILGLVGMAMWSVAGFWGFPDVFPASFTLRSWTRHGPDIFGPGIETAVIAITATGLALALTLACLEAEARYGLRPGVRALWLLYLPLLVPQVAFLLGLQMLALLAGIDGGRNAVIAAHLVFVLPYVFLSLAEPFRTWDARYAQAAAALGAGPNRIFWAVRMPMLLRPVLTAFAVGMASSIGQYLPTLLVGGGQVQTLTTEAVALASGGNRRIIGIYALAQTAAAFIPFVLALMLPRLLWRNRRGLRDG